MAKKAARNIRLKLYKQILLEADDGCSDITIIVDEDGNKNALGNGEGSQLEEILQTADCSSLRVHVFSGSP